MHDLIVWALGAVPGAMIGYHAGAWRYAERLRGIARNMPRDSVALATLERLERETRGPLR